MVVPAATPAWIHAAPLLIHKHAPAHPIAWNTRHRSAHGVKTALLLGARGLRAQEAGGLPRKDTWGKQLLAMAFSGALLGPVLDGYHSAFEVLRYAASHRTLPLHQIQVPKDVYAGPLFVCQSDYWVPPMFALAAVILGAAYPYLDAKLGVNVCWAEPSVPTVLTSIGYFCAQYWLSGALTSSGVGGTPLHGILATTALAAWWFWDRTPSGAIMAVVTGTAGPLLEVGLTTVFPSVAGFPLYTYLHPDGFGIPYWIMWVYACGAPANGNLSRLYLRVFADDRVGDDS